MNRGLSVLLVLAAAAPANAAEQAIGRLFYTPAERATLEDARRRNIRAEELAAQAKETPKEPLPREVVVTGVVLRSDGESFAWVNGKAVERETRDGLRVRHTAHPSGVVVYDPEKRRTVQVKVGQHADLQTGRVEESYASRRRSADQPAASGSQPAPTEMPPSRGQKPAARGQPKGDTEKSGKDSEQDASGG